MDDQIPKKRGRKPKIQTEQVDEDADEESSVQLENDEEPRKRKRGRKPKCEIKSIQDIRQKFNNAGGNDKVVFQGSNEQVESDLVQVQIPFGNLNILVHSAKPVDKDELRSMFSNAKRTEPGSTKPLESSPIETLAKHVGTKMVGTTRSFCNGSESESECDSRRIRKLYIPLTSVASHPTAPAESVEIIQKNKVKINRLLYKFINKAEETKEWPTKCNTLCWWCCHSFESIPIPCISKYDSIRKRFKIYGIFCSWNCSAAYAMKENDSVMNLQLLKREWTGDTSNIERSPSRYILKAFGGHMSIEEYRNNNGVQRSFHITKNNMDFVNHNCIETYTETSKKVKSKYKLKRKNDCTVLRTDANFIGPTRSHLDEY